MKINIITSDLTTFKPRQCNYQMLNIPGSLSFFLINLYYQKLLCLKYILL